jgi:hypothetical protein
MDTTETTWASTDRVTAGISWRRCEFCDCKTNASERICCPRGRAADRKNWDRSALNS